MTTKAKIGESLVEMATRLYGHVTGVFWLLEDNENLRIDQEFTSEEDVNTRAEIVKLLAVGQVAFKKVKLPKYPLLDRQSFFDVVIENQGSVMGAFDVAEANGFDGLTEHIFTGQNLEILEVATAPRVRDVLAKNMPICTITEAEKSDGIGFMFIERNFIIR